MTTKLEIKEENGDVFCKIADRGGRWGRPLVDDKGNFYRSACVAAEALNVSSPTVRNAVLMNMAIRDRMLRFATLAETEANQGGGRILTTTISNQATMTTTATTEKQATTTPFAGVKWPDGTVTVRLSAGGDWSMTRTDISQLPEEIRGGCAWL